ncbi:orotate phosphoribosyltransferase [Candidatus Saccharibacteria bacterium]|nr:orotate phosphoribosyltransferase [Candidatus Saccharibacteria bacterium]
MLSQEAKKKLALELYKIGVIKFGDFTFKSGIVSPMYVDLRILVSYPKILKYITQEYVKILKNLKFDRIAGIPYAAMPIASAVSLEMQKPLIYRRKESKGYGTNKRIEGEYKKGETIAIIDDLITKGDSKLETMETFLAEGLKIEDFIVLLDYEKGGSEILRKKGYRLYSAMTIAELIDNLYEAQAINGATYKEVKKFLAQK